MTPNATAPSPPSWGLNSAKSWPSQRAHAITTVSGNVIADTRWMFVALCFYVASQAYTVPILAIGAWAIWPNLADFAIGLMIAACVFVPRRSRTMLPTHRTILRVLILILLASYASFVISTLLTRLTSVPIITDKRIIYGGHTLGRLTEFFILFGLVSIIPLTPSRIRTLSRVATPTLVITSLAIIATYFKIVTTADFVGHLPRGKDVAGPWENFRINYDQEGLGAIGYNHHYVAAQVVLLLGLCVALKPNRSVGATGFLILISTAAIFLSGSRSVLGADVILICVLLFRRSVIKPGIFLLAASALFLLVGILTTKPEALGQEPSIIARQTTTFQFYNSQNLSGRDDIWQGKLHLLMDRPTWWLFGRGIGASVDLGPGTSAHMMPLQLLIETGFVGLVSIVASFGALLLCLFRSGPHGRGYLWITGALLLTASSYETFYPIPSMGHFLGLFLCILAITLRLDQQGAGEERRIEDRSPVWSRATCASS